MKHRSILTAQQVLQSSMVCSRSQGSLIFISLISSNMDSRSSSKFLSTILSSRRTQVQLPILALISSFCSINFSLKRSPNSYKSLWRRCKKGRFQSVYSFISQANNVSRRHPGLFPRQFPQWPAAADGKTAVWKRNLKFVPSISCSKSNEKMGLSMRKFLSCLEIFWHG